MNTISTTLAALVQMGCDTGLERWLSHELARRDWSDCALVPVVDLLAAEDVAKPGLDWALWSLRAAVPRQRAEAAAREIAVACAERVLHVIQPWGETCAHLAIRAARESIGSGPTPDLSRLRDAMWAKRWAWRDGRGAGRAP